MSEENTGEKSAKGQFRKGPDPRRGHGLKGPGMGRPTNEFRESLRALISSPKVKAAVKKILENGDHRQFGRVYQTVISQAHGNPVQPIELDSASLPEFSVVTTKKGESAS